MGGSLPAQPAYGTNVPFFYTVPGEWCRYDGTRWLGSEKAIPLIAETPEGGNIIWGFEAPIDTSGSGVYVTCCDLTTINVVNTGANFVSYQLYSRSPATTLHSLGSAVGTKGDTAGQFASHPITVNAVVTAGDPVLYLLGTLTGAPTGIYAWPVVYYRPIYT